MISIVHMELPSIPRIITRPEHPISRSLISPNALKVLCRLKDNDHIVYLVGGCVRDLLLGREPKDFDVATDATPGQIKKLFRNCRLVGRRFRLAHLHFRDEIIEVATFRAPAPDEEESGKHAIPDTAEPPTHPRHVVSDEGVVLRDNLFGTPAEDAMRRDFTVNALAYDITDFSIIDFVGGMEDLERGVIRTIGDPMIRFIEDPVRMLRAIRFSALLGFTMEETTRLALIENAPAITRASAPRLYEEMLKLFLSGEGERSYQLMRQLNLFAHLFPGLNARLDQEMEGFPYVRIGRGLEWVDRRVGEGKMVSQPLLLSLMFGGCLEERAAHLRETGRPPQEALNEAVSGFLGEQVSLVAIPHKAGLFIREILSLQDRLRKIPGKRPQGVLARPGFEDALTYLRCRFEFTGEDGEVLAWWERYASEKILPPVEEKSLPPRQGKPRRRRRRRKTSSDPS